jgi:uncharacterized protein
MHPRSLTTSAICVICAAAIAATAATAEHGNGRRNAFQFTPLPTSAACVPGGVGTFPNEQPFLLPAGFDQEVIARQGDGGSTDNWDMNVMNETGRAAGRFLFRTHEVVENGQVTVTDLSNNTTRVLAQRADWNRLDGIVWTPWKTLLVTEEMRPLRLPSLPDPDNPAALAGLVFEVDPATGESIARPALGAKAHEGIRFDRHGNIYGISETAPTTVLGGQPRPGGYIFKFTPDRPHDLSSGQLYALKIVHDRGDRTGEAVWLPLDRDAVRIDADAEATRVGATGYARPEDVETATSTGNDVNPGENLYVAVTDEHRVLKVTLDDGHEDHGRGHANGHGHRPGGGTAFVSDYVRAGVNAPAITNAPENRFSNPDNLALDKAGNLYITEDTTNEVGMDIWVAAPSRRGSDLASRVARFASLTDCTAEPSGIYFDLDGDVLYAHTLHRQGQDLSVAITERHRERGHRFDD